MIKINRPNCPNPLALQRNYRNADNKLALIKASYGKCMYCESKILHTSFGDIEHIKPKSRFPNLEFDWLNLGFVCTKCNNSKSDKFEDTTPYINPYDEDPENEVISIGAILKHKKGSERGELTIKDIDLNRVELIEKRQTRLTDIQNTIDRCMRTKNERLKKLALASLLEDTTSDKEYSLFVKTLFKLHGLL